MRCNRPDVVITVVANSSFAAHRTGGGILSDAAKKRHHCMLVENRAAFNQRSIMSCRVPSIPPTEFPFETEKMLQSDLVANGTVVA